MCHAIRVKNNSYDTITRDLHRPISNISHKGVTHGHVPAEFGWFGRCFTAICWRWPLPYSGGLSGCLALTACRRLGWMGGTKLRMSSLVYIKAQQHDILSDLILYLISHRGLKPARNSSRNAIVINISYHLRCRHSLQLLSRSSNHIRRPLFFESNPPSSASILLSLPIPILEL